MYTIGKFHGQNIGPFGDVTVDFATPGLTVIEGDMQNKPGFDNNATGKSMLYEGVVWVLYDRFIRPNYSGDDVVRLGSKGGAAGSVILHSDAGHKLEVRRYRKHPEFKNNVYMLVDDHDVTNGTNPEMNAAIVRELGMDFMAAMNTVFFGAREDVKSFFFATDEDRKSLLERVLVLKDYSAGAVAAKAAVARYVRELTEKRQQLLEVQQAVEQGNAYIAGLASETDTEAREAELLRVRETLRALSAQQVRLASRQVELQQALTHYQKEYQAALDRYETDMTVYDEWCQARDSAIRVARDATLQASTVLDTLRRNRRRVATLAEGSCPTCAQVVNKARQAPVLAKLDEEIVAQEKKWSAAQTEENKVRQKYTDKPKTPPVAPVEKTDTEEHQAERQVELELNDLENRMETAAERRQELEGALAHSTASRAAAEKEIGAARDTAAALEVDIKALEHKMLRAEFWVEGYGNRGFKSFLLEARLPEINRVATVYARRFMGEGAYVRLKAVTQLKSKDAVREKLTVEACVPGLTEKYAGASRGTKKRLDLCLILAFRDVGAQRAAKNINQLFVDELFDGMDPAGVDTVVDVLREVAHDCPIHLITHDPRLKHIGDRLLTVQHNGSVTAPEAVVIETKG